MNDAVIIKAPAHVEISASKARLHYMDNVRALAMMAGILFHAALSYSPLLHNLWPTASSQNHAVFDILSFFSHLFRMPVFFLISGFFALMLLEKRGINGFLKNRMLRVAVPFLIFLPLLLLAVGAIFSWAFVHVANPSPVLGFVKMMSSMPESPEAPISTMHLWFLYYLLMFVLVVALLYRMKFFAFSVINKVTSPLFITLFFPLLLVPSLFVVVAPHPAPEQWLPEWWAVGFYGLFFVLGAAIFKRQDVLSQFNQYKHLLLVVSVAAFAYIYSTLPETISPQMIMLMSMGTEMSLSHLPVAIAEAYVSVYMSVYSLLLGKQFLNKENKVLRLVSDSSYWVYLIHLPLLFWVQFYLLDSSLNMFWQFTLSCSLTLFVGLVSYLLLIKRTPIGWLLNGRRLR